MSEQVAEAFGEEVHVGYPKVRSLKSVTFDLSQRLI